MTDAEKAQIESEIGQITDSLMATWNAMDTDAYMAFYSPTRISVAWGGTIHRDIPSLRERQENWFAARESWVGEWIEKTVEVLAQDAAVFQGVYDCTITFPDGRIFHWPGNASWIVVFRREDGEWKMTFVNGSAGTAERLDEA